jgi:hypothetical protein
MRLENVASGHGLLAKLKLGMFRLIMRARAPDVIRTILYRPELFGKAFSEATHAALRGASEWSVGERELFAAFVSKLNQCVF